MEFQQAVIEALKSIQADALPPADTYFVTHFSTTSDTDSTITSVFLKRRIHLRAIETHLGRVKIVPGGFLSKLRCNPSHYGQSAISSVFFTHLVDALRCVIDNPWTPHPTSQGLITIGSFSGVSLWEYTTSDSKTYGALGVVAPTQLFPCIAASLQNVPVCVFYRQDQDIGEVRRLSSTAVSANGDQISAWKGAFYPGIWVEGQFVNLPKSTGKHLGPLVARMARNLTDAACIGASAHTYAQVLRRQNDIPTRVDAFLSELDARRRLAMPVLYRSDAERSDIEQSDVDPLAHPI